MEVKQYKITIDTRATLVYYVSEYDVDSAIGAAMEAPFKEWEVSDFENPMDDNITIDVGRSY